MRPQLSVIVPCYNAAETIGETLAGLAAQEWDQPWETVVVDNGSTDESRSVIESFRSDFRDFRIVNAHERRGRATALNAGMSAARGDAVAFCDADDVPAAGWVAAMGQALAGHGFVASRYDWRKLNAPELVRLRGEPQKEELQRLWYPPFTLHSGGSGLGLRREMWERHGLFDESLRNCHDTEMCIRLQLAGVPLHLARGATMHMRCRRRPLEVLRQAREWGLWNQVVYQRYGQAGPAPERPWAAMLSAWRDVGRRLKRFVRRREFARAYRLAWAVGHQLGTLEGSLRARVRPYPYPRRPKRTIGRSVETPGPEKQSPT